MYDIQKEFETFSKLSREELFAICPGLVFEREDSGILYFTANVPEAFIKLMDETWYLDSYFDDGVIATGYYRDGTRVHLHKRRHVWEFRHGKTEFVIVRLSGTYD